MNWAGLKNMEELYSRLPKDDGKHADSMSIRSQKVILKQYEKQTEYSLSKDGYSKYEINNLRNLNNKEFKAEFEEL
ncbi:MAG: hypothetical protein E7D92_05390 [Anaerococcus sp.]|uniref:Uncharacterized protein n=2 Tax=Anaerococcus nagyae TaxID=1755241 RepID=A0A3E2THI2_9FIRM|nr:MULTISPECIES: hypothetical protein [Anaerococcus]MDU2354017.1 hypothetical protein [Anaerococcus sp.]MDU3211485.1 hypothetical protein [Anaerococcus sp.]RGB75884.1 hypothetical protein DXA39_06055 [Anaerococcus nagyae]